MRRSQRLIKYRDVVDKAECLDKSGNSITDDRNAKQQIQIFERKTDNGSNTNEICLPQLFNSINDGQSIGRSNKDTWNKSSKTNAKVQEVNTNNSNPSEENKSTMRSQNKRCTAAPSSRTTRKARKRGTSQPKMRQNKKRRTEAISNEFEVKAPIISIDNYFNPIRHPLIQVEANAQTRPNNDFYYHNINIPTNYIQSTKDSLLPPMYPNHFVNQNYINSFINQQQLQSFAALDENNIQSEIHFPTPDLTQSLDLDSSTSTISLTDSLRELFGCDDIRDVLKLDKVIFRMSRLHLQTLAFVLNIEFDYLHNLVEKIMKLDTETLQKVIFAFQPEVNSQNDTVTNK